MGYDLFYRALRFIQAVSLSFDSLKLLRFIHPSARNPKIYLEAARHLSLPPQNCAMVAAHIYDLRAAAKVGMRTVYVRRPGEDLDAHKKPADVKNKEEGGDVDYVVDSFTALAEIVARINAED